MRSHPSPAQPLALENSRFSHICTHLCTHICTNTPALTSGEILEGCRMQSCKAGKKTLNFSLFLETALLQDAFPSGFSFSSTPSTGRAPGDAVTALGGMVQGSRGTGGSQCCSCGTEQQNSLKGTVRRAFQPNNKRSPSGCQLEHDRNEMWKRIG